MQYKICLSIEQLEQLLQNQGALLFNQNQGDYYDEQECFTAYHEAFVDATSKFDDWHDFPDYEDWLEDQGFFRWKDFKDVLIKSKGSVNFETF